MHAIVQDRSQSRSTVILNPPATRVGGVFDLQTYAASLAEALHTRIEAVYSGTHVACLTVSEDDNTGSSGDKSNINLTTLILLTVSLIFFTCIFTTNQLVLTKLDFVSDGGTTVSDQRFMSRLRFQTSQQPLK
ncbi:MAG: hypothetical protein EOP04_29245 [Proteobacteria bacterium]|nr:MAG: hypothetical protein EOP04_29245 [Pseudomonadota bacterium]